MSLEYTLTCLIFEFVSTPLTNVPYIPNVDYIISEKEINWSTRVRKTDKINHAVRRKGPRGVEPPSSQDVRRYFFWYFH